MVFSEMTQTGTKYMNFYKNKTIPRVSFYFWISLFNHYFWKIILQMQIKRLINVWQVKQEAIIKKLHLND